MINDAVFQASQILKRFGVEPQAVERMTETTRLALMYDMVARYAASSNRAVNLFRPFPGDGEEFLKCKARIQIATGSNRGGKTTHVAWKVAMCLLGYGEQFGLPAKNGRIIAVGENWDHVGMVMWRKLAWPGQFRVIRDAKTAGLRSIRLDPTRPGAMHPEDLLRLPEWLPAPPFLSRTDLEIAWFRRNLDQPRKIIVPSTGWECLFESSEGDPLQGVDVHLVWLDEEIKREQWVSEMLMRILDQSGQLWWGFTPRAATPQAYEFHKQAEAGMSHVKEFRFLIADNPFLPEVAKREIYESISPEEREVRWFGKYAIQSRRVYPEFDSVVAHNFSEWPVTEDPTAPTPPKDWMRVFSVDPGFQTCGVLFGAVPPEGHASYPKLFIYDEIYAHSASCGIYGAELAKRTQGSEWEVAVVDHRYGRQSQPTSGRPLVEHYMDEHKERGIRTRLSEHGFVWGSDNVVGRTDALHAMLDGRFLVVHPRCVNFIREMGNEYFMPNSPDTRNARKYGHLVACMEMMAGYFDSAGGIYHRLPAPIPEKVPASLAAKAFRRKQDKQKREAAHFGERGRDD